MKILIVDDEKMMRTLTRKILSQNYEVVMAESGKEAVEIYEKERPDLILSDLLMPEMDGFEMHKILQEKYGINIPIMYMTADESEEVEDKGFDLGASDFIRKPFRPETLLRRVENILDNLAIIQDLTEEATVDKLTGFLNKASTEEIISQAIVKDDGVLMIIDLDSFKLVNDIYGHESGDKILMSCAAVIKKNTNPEDIRGRIGGDEFLAFSRNISSEEVVKDIADKINKDMIASAKEILGEDMTIPLGASVGAVFVKASEFKIDDVTPDAKAEYLHNIFEDLYKKADRALYKIKENGKRGCAFHRDEIETTDETVASIEELHRVCKVLEERNMSNAALWLGQEAFSVTYKFMLRYIKSYHSVAYTVLITLLNKDNALDTESFNKLSEEFGDVVNHSLRKSDLMMQHKPNQYLLLLPELSEEFVETVFARIRNQWKKHPDYDKTVIRFDAEKIGDDADEPNIKEQRASDFKKELMIPKDMISEIMKKNQS